MQLTANTTTPMSGSGDATFTLPVTSVAYAPNVDGTPGLGTGGACDDSANFTFLCSGIWVSTTTGELKIHSAGGTYTGMDPMTSAAPFSWTTSDEIFVQGIYEAA